MINLSSPLLRQGGFIATAPSDAVIYLFPHPVNPAAMASQCHVQPLLFFSLFSWAEAANLSEIAH
jgi:hypothetical protein